MEVENRDPYINGLPQVTKIHNSLDAANAMKVNCIHYLKVR